MDTFSRWMRLALLNLCLVALLGTVMRYKIGFEFPFFNQKYIQEAHSHFAFTGWITHALYFLIVLLLKNNGVTIHMRTYKWLININLVIAYGMLISFFLQGYGLVSIIFSTLSILLGYVFSFVALRDLQRLPTDHPAKNWLKAAIWLGIISTAGTAVLSFMMATFTYDQEMYLGAVYFYLHFQYNGWFLFACMGLFLDRIKDLNLNGRTLQKIFWLFFLSGVPTFFLSTLWADLPAILYVFVIIAAILQVIGWWYFFLLIMRNLQGLNGIFPRLVRHLYLIVAAAMTIKLFLQLGSTIPAVSKLAFGFRPIVIAYLHLVLLLIVTIFLLTFLYEKAKLPRAARVPLIGFTIGVILNEIVLAVQGIASFSYTVIPKVNEALFVVALVLLTSAIWLFLSLRNKDHSF